MVLQQQNSDPGAPRGGAEGNSSDDLPDFAQLFSLMTIEDIEQINEAINQLGDDESIEESETIDQILINILQREEEQLIIRRREAQARRQAHIRRLETLIGRAEMQNRLLRNAFYNENNESDQSVHIRHSEFAMSNSSISSSWTGNQVRLPTAFRVPTTDYSNSSRQFGTGSYYSEGQINEDESEIHLPQHLGENDDSDYTFENYLNSLLNATRVTNLDSDLSETVPSSAINPYIPEININFDSDIVSSEFRALDSILRNQIFMRPTSQIEANFARAAREDAELYLKYNSNVRGFTPNTWNMIRNVYSLVTGENEIKCFEDDKKAVEVTGVSKVEDKEYMIKVINKIPDDNTGCTKLEQVCITSKGCLSSEACTR